MEKIPHPVISRGEYSNYTIPPLSLLDEENGKNFSESLNVINDNGEKLLRCLAMLNINANICKTTPALRFTRYTIAASETDIEKILDIEYLVEFKNIHICKENSTTVNIDIMRNSQGITAVRLRPLLETHQRQNCKLLLPMALGRDLCNEPIILDLAKMPHLLIAGSCGTGKSICINDIIAGLLYKYSPDKLRFIMSDLKCVEYTQYQNLPHLQFPIVNNCLDTLTLLHWTLNELESRKLLLQQSAVRSIEEYNASHSEKMPYIIFFIDDLADLMRQDHELAVIAQKVIADIAEQTESVGIHLIICTQVPSTGVITAEIKKHIPFRIGFRVSFCKDSQAILDETGAESLYGAGDMLIKTDVSASLIRGQGVFVRDHEIEKIIKFISESYLDNCEKINPLDQSIENMKSVADEIKIFICPGDTYGFLEAVKLVIAEPEKASTSYLQRNLKIGYNRAAEYMDLLRERGVIKA